MKSISIEIMLERSLSPLLLNMLLQGLPRVIRQEKGKKGDRNVKGRGQSTSLLTDDMIQHIGNPRDSTRNP